MKIETELPDLHAAHLDPFEFICEQERFVFEGIIPKLVSMWGREIEKYMDSHEDMVHQLAQDEEFAPDVAALRRVGLRLIAVADAVEAKYTTQPRPAKGEGE